MVHAVPTRAHTALVAAACLAATLVILVSPRLPLGFRAETLHLVLDTVDACVALLVVYLLVGRFQRDRTLRSLLLACGLLLLASANLAGGLAHDARPLTLDVWLPQSLRVLGAMLIAAGALTRARVDVRRARVVITLVGGVVPVVVGALWVARAGLPVALESAPPPANTATLTGHPALLAGHAIGALAFLVAALAVTLARDREHDEMLRWFGVAFVLGTFARIHYLFYPSIYSGWFYTGDVLRTGCYLLLLIGAAREISSHWAAQPRLAVVADRKRVARELHDGVVQELGLIRAEAHRVPDGAVRTRILDAAGRGLDEARAAIETLDRGGDEPLSLQLHRAARQLTERYGARVVVDLDVSVQVTADQAHSLLRIAREAVANAVRHGGASAIGIGLLRDATSRMLVIHDDGDGFDPGDQELSGYGLTSIRDRAAGLPGEVEVRSAPGRGTTVTVTW